MSRTTGSARRSGDPRRRSAAPARSAARPHRALAVALPAALGLVAVAVWALPGSDASSERAPAAAMPGHQDAAAACELTAQAGQAAEGDSRARYAAAVFLLDRAVIAAERAVAASPEFAELEEAVQRLHTAGHRRDPEQWTVTLETARSACGPVLG